MRFVDAKSKEKVFLIKKSLWGNLEKNNKDECKSQSPPQRILENVTKRVIFFTFQPDEAAPKRNPCSQCLSKGNPSQLLIGDLSIDDDLVYEDEDDQKYLWPKMVGHILDIYISCLSNIVIGTIVLPNIAL